MDIGWNLQAIRKIGMFTKREMAKIFFKVTLHTYRRWERGRLWDFYRYAKVYDKLLRGYQAAINTIKCRYPNYYEIFWRY